MAEHSHGGPVEMGAEMDYPEHEKSFDVFIGMVKYGSLASAATLIAMAFGFFTAAGFFSSLVLFIIICAIGAFILR